MTFRKVSYDCSGSIGYFHQWMLEYYDEDGRTKEYPVALVENESGRMVRVDIQRITFIEPPVLK